MKVSIDSAMARQAARSHRPSRCAAMPQSLVNSRRFLKISSMPCFSSMSGTRQGDVRHVVHAQNSRRVDVAKDAELLPRGLLELGLAEADDDVRRQAQTSQLLDVVLRRLRLLLADHT